MAGALVRVPAIELQASPPIYVAVLPGTWLLRHTTPSWRIKDPLKGFQRIVRNDRARQIARTVIDQGRAFPNAITLATNLRRLSLSNGELELPNNAKLLVVDGQHRLFAQHYSETTCQYACIIHLQRTEEQMAELFLEINDNQRRVPSSLRWDLVRLVRAGDESAITASDIVFELATREDSPFYIAIDLTGEGKDVSIRQGSLAPEIKTLVGRLNKQRSSAKPTVEEYVALLIRFFAGVRSLDPDGWGNGQSHFYKARVLRALIRVLADLAARTRSLGTITAASVHSKLANVTADTLSEENIRLSQGSAGVTNLYKSITAQLK